MHINDVETPVAVVDLDLLESHIKRFQEYLDQHGIANRPHIKTHKIPAIAKMQVDAGAIGITCQKLGEAEVMADGGITDIFVPYNIIGESKLKRLIALAKRIKMSVTVDSEYTLQGIVNAFKDGDAQLTVLVEIDTGMGRCGVQTPEEAAYLARIIHGATNLTFGGLMTYPPMKDDRTGEFVAATRELLAADGISINCVSGGGTQTMWKVHELPEITEYRAGMYIFGDRYTMSHNTMQLDEIAFKVIATVVSRPTENRGILDAGSKTFSSDLLGLQNHGYIMEYPEARFYGMSEEHGNVDFSACEKKPQIGERVTIVVNHCCPVVNLFNQLVGVRGDEVEVVWDVAARGKLQ